MTDLSFFLALETRVWQALVTGDALADQAMLAPEFLGVYSTGFAVRDEHCGQLSDGPTVACFALDQARLMPLGPGRMLLAYRAEFTRTGKQIPEVMFVSSIWEQHDDTWLNIFSQDTAESDVAPV